MESSLETRITFVRLNHYLLGTYKETKSPRI